MSMKRWLVLALCIAMLAALAACAKEETQTSAPSEQISKTEQRIVLSDNGVICDDASVYTAHDIIYYEEGKGDTYGAGTQEDAHSAQEAQAHTVVHITKAGTYRVSGKLSAGQLFVDLGEDTKKNPDACVTLILDGVDITCTVAPAVLFYRVYECTDKEEYTLTPNLSNAGAVVRLEGENTVNGSYVAKIYKEGTTDKLYKFDGAFYSRRSMRIEGDGALTIQAENEGLDTELHLQIDGGKINITAQDDGINTNEDGISVTTVNGGELHINAGLGTEGDGIDSNGALVINGGTVYAMANPRTGDGGLDADVGIYLNGGSVIACGSRNDEVNTDSEQRYMELSFAENVAADSKILLSEDTREIMSFTAERDFSSLILSCPELQLDTAYTLRVNGKVQQHGGGMSKQPDGQRPDPPQDGQENGNPPEPPQGGQEGGNAPEPPQRGTATPSDLTPPSNQRPTSPQGQQPTPPDGQTNDDTEVSTEFTLTKSKCSFYQVKTQEAENSE